MRRTERAMKQQGRISFRLLELAIFFVWLCAGPCGVWAQGALGSSPSASAPQAEAPAKPANSLGDFIVEMFKMHGDKTLCTSTGEPYGPQAFITVRDGLINELRQAGQKSASSDTLARALWTRYPCPFSPARAELLPARAKDVEGVWIFPQTSESLRFSRLLDRDTRNSMTGPVPVVCEAVAYFPEGELRTSLVAGRLECPYKSAGDMASSRQQPLVSSWKMLRPGRLSVERTDVPNHIEEWDVHVVVMPFDVRGVTFRVGDLIQYQRKVSTGDSNASLQFRHLRALPSPPATPEEALWRQREEAGSFFVRQAALLSMLRQECAHMAADAKAGPDAVAREWWQIHQSDLEASVWIGEQVLLRRRAKESPDRVPLADLKFLQAFSEAMEVDRLGAFQGQLPTGQSCARALRRYTLQSGDSVNPDASTGIGRAFEFSETLKQVRMDPDYRPRSRTFEEAIPVAKEMLLTDVAIREAMRRSDGAAVMAGIRSLVDSGDVRAAHQLGLFYLNGRFVSRNPLSAAAWFYNAWSMGAADGVNALGVMWRDGAGTEVDNVRALAAFGAAATIALRGNDKAALQRARGNYSRLALSARSEEVSRATCMSWGELVQAAHDWVLGASAVPLRNRPEILQQPLLDPVSLGAKVPQQGACAAASGTSPTR